MRLRSLPDGKLIECLDNIHYNTFLSCLPESQANPDRRYIAIPYAKAYIPIPSNLVTVNFMKYVALPNNVFILSLSTTSTGLTNIEIDVLYYFHGNSYAPSYSENVHLVGNNTTHKIYNNYNDKYIQWSWNEAYIKNNTINKSLVLYCIVT